MYQFIEPNLECKMLLDVTIHTLAIILCCIQRGRPAGVVGRVPKDSGYVIILTIILNSRSKYNKHFHR